MDKIKKILVPTDFSECAWAALRHATLWANYCGAEIHLLHVCRVPWHLGPTKSSGEEHHALEAVARTRAEAEMGRFIEYTKSQSNLELRSSVAHGTPRNVILEIAELNEYDLIVMGTHGRTGLAHLFLGSTTEGVVRRAPCPVLTVGNKAAEFIEPQETTACSSPGEIELRRILVPVDFSPHSTAALEYALRLNRLFNAAIDVQHVVEVQPSYFPVGGPLLSARSGNWDSPFVKLAERRAEEQIAAMLKSFDARGWNIVQKVSFGYPQDALIRAADNYDLIVVGTHGRKGLSHFFLGSVAEQIVRRASCPVLTIHGPQGSD